MAAALGPVYREHAPEVAQIWRPVVGIPRVHAGGADPFAAGGEFAPAVLKTYPWQRRVSTDEWVGMAATISDHQRLGSERLATLLRALRTAIDGLGGVIRTRHETYALLSRRH